MKLKIKRKKNLWKGPATYNYTVYVSVADWVVDVEFVQFFLDLKNNLKFKDHLISFIQSVKI